MKKLLLATAIIATPLTATAEESSWMSSLGGLWESAQGMISGSSEEATTEAAAESAEKMMSDMVKEKAGEMAEEAMGSMDAMGMAKGAAKSAVDSTEMSDDNKTHVKGLIDSNL